MKFLLDIVRDRYSFLDIVPIATSAIRFNEGEYLLGILWLIGGMFVVSLVTALIRVVARGGDT